MDWLIPPKTKVPDPSYKNVKLLGTKLDTTYDIKARKAKVWDPIKKNSMFFRSKHLSVSHKIRLYKSFVEPILLYNSETWTLTTKMEESLDAFHRRLLRIALNCRYPKIIKNSKLYTLTKEVPISETIKKRRLALFGHILRLDPETPVQKALDYYTVHHERPVGRPPTTWLSMIKKDIKPTIKQQKIKKFLTISPYKN